MRNVWGFQGLKFSVRGLKVRGARIGGLEGKGTVFTQVGGFAGGPRRRVPGLGFANLGLEAFQGFRFAFWYLGGEGGFQG